ncbi:TLDc domain-containing protein [Entamoeba marina]
MKGNGMFDKLTKTSKKSFIVSCIQELVVIVQSLQKQVQTLSYQVQGVNSTLVTDALNINSHYEAIMYAINNPMPAISDVLSTQYKLTPNDVTPFNSILANLRKDITPLATYPSSMFEAIIRHPPTDLIDSIVGLTLSGDISDERVEFIKQNLPNKVLQQECKEIKRSITKIAKSNAIGTIDEKAHQAVENDIGDEDLVTLKRWVMKERCEILYSSNGLGDIIEFNKSVSGRKDVSIVVRTDNGFVFGGHFGEFPIASGLSVSKGIVDPNHFIFSLCGCRGGKRKRFRRKTNEEAIWLMPVDETEAFVQIHAAFYLQHFHSSFVYQNIQEFYTVNEEEIDIFTGNHFPERFGIRSMYVFQWK